MNPIKKFTIPALIGGAIALSAASPSHAAKVNIADDPSQGDTAAPLVLIEFADYQ